MGRMLEIRYKIMGRNEAGHWILRGFDRDNRPCGSDITYRTVQEVYRAYIEKNGFKGMTPEEMLYYQETF